MCSLAAEPRWAYRPQLQIWLVPFQAHDVHAVQPLQQLLVFCKVLSICAAMLHNTPHKVVDLCGDCRTQHAQQQQYPRSAVALFYRKQKSTRRAMP
jgi:hypothetical protein